MSVRCSVDDAVAWITLDRPEVMNAISIELATALTAAVTGCAADPAVNAIVVRGAGGNFCAGGDFGEVQRLRAQGSDALAALFAAFGAACAAIEAADTPVIAAVEGVAAAGGFELMQAADIVLISADARVADNHVRFGMIPGGGGSARLPRLVGRQQAMGLLLSGDRISGTEAVAMQLAYRAYPADEFDAGVAAFARALAGRDRTAVATIKRLVRTGIQDTVADALAAEQQAVVAHIMGPAGARSTDQFASRGADR